jgi:hypothetical protein
MAEISFLWFVSPFGFQVRMRRDFDIRLFGIIDICEIWEDSGKECYERVYDGFEVAEELKKIAFIVIRRYGIRFGRMVTLNYIGIRKWLLFGPEFSNWELMGLFNVDGGFEWQWLLMRFLAWEIVLLASQLFVYCTPFIARWVYTFAEGTFSWKVWWFCTGGREVFTTTLDTYRVMGAVVTNVAVGLAVLALWNLSLFIGFFNYDFRV